MQHYNTRDGKVLKFRPLSPAAREAIIRLRQAEKAEPAAEEPFWAQLLVAFLLFGSLLLLTAVASAVKV